MSFFIFENNPLDTRQDLVNAHNELFNGLKSKFSTGGARVRVSEFGSACTVAAAEFEGFSRPLWGIVPLIYGGDEFDFLDTYKKGIVNGCNPDHEEYWGHPGDFSQLLVDLAALAFALCMCKEQFWDPLTHMDQQIVIKYLQEASKSEFCDTNWKFFKVLIDTALEKVGADFDSASTTAYLDDIESMYLGDGWYGDGKKHRIDHYNGFAMHFYGLLYIHLKRHDDAERCSRLMERAELFAKHFVHWFNDDGAVLPYGRSLIYRFAVVGFWGMLPFVSDPNKEPALPWGVMKKVYLGNLKWWSTQPILEHDSTVLSLGYGYPNCFMTERYNSPQSPYWAMKGFSGLLMKESHPFWKAEIKSDKKSDTKLMAAKSHYISPIGMYITHTAGNTISLINGPWNDEYNPEKYSKFAYSTRYGFGVINNHRSFDKAHLDNSIGFSFNNKEFSVREKYQAFTTTFEGQLVMVSKWSPMDGITVESHMIPKQEYHIRIHKIDNSTNKEVFIREGGFAIPDSTKAITTIDETTSSVETPNDFSLIRDIYGNRTPSVCDPEPNSNILHPKVLLPQLIGSVASSCNVTVGSIVFGASTAFDVPLLPTHFGYKMCGEYESSILCNQ